ncbi:SLAP domain-containing protein [Lactobacillus xylocopicola]|uniref:DUF5110 domain-containing protein n=1 Tax=Lactobacillus xylocopicola TaxID=2976676 RepID=A0ABN6SIA5_9LACO|nr:SLAP domain-containing protein [Lactobacillus xylocopicola]BDR60053.1 hypothetical protein KIM322_03140 [Lactobacillus xylocopicola]
MAYNNNQSIKNKGDDNNHHTFNYLSAGVASVAIATGFVGILSCPPRVVSAAVVSSRTSMQKNKAAKAKVNVAKLKAKKKISSYAMKNNQEEPVKVEDQADTKQPIGLKDSDEAVQQSITDITKQEKYFEVNYANGQVARLYVLSPKMFRYYIDPDKKYEEHEQSEAGLNAKILQEDGYGTAGMANTTLAQTEKGWKLATGVIDINFDQTAGTMSVNKGDRVILQETEPVKITAKATTQTLKDDQGSNYFGGGTQNGKFRLTGEAVKIVNTNNWVDQGVASPNPFYWSSKGYGVLRYTFKAGNYDFDTSATGTIATTHNESRFDAIYFFDDSSYDLIHDYQELTGLPALTPIYGFYEAHLNAYNRDYWVEVPANTAGAIKYPDGKYYKEYQPASLPADLKDRAIRETLNGEKGGVDYQFSARAMIDQYLDHDMPIGWFLPNDGYGAGYGQTDSLAGNLQNLADFIDYANSKGVQVGLWTQQNLKPVDPANPKPSDRDFEKEIQAGVTALKTDVAWVGNGYSFGLNGTQTAANMINKIKGDLLRPFIITLDGWSGTQNTGAVWTGDETGGQWEYIRFQIPTYIGSGLSGQPNSASDMDGIFGGKNPVINARDYQWKAFTPIQLNMDGWGYNPKNPFAFDEHTTNINRAYLKQKSMLLPYIYSMAADATFAGKPMVRAMFLDYPDYPEAYTDLVKYQYMWGDNFLIAPIYQNTASDSAGNDIRNGIYLPDKNQIWVDYYTGKEYQGGQVLDNFAAPLWKLPVFVKAGAIIPVADATNTPKEYLALQNQRRFELYPNGTSSFKVYEDDGISAQYKAGKYAQTLVKSELQGSNLTISVAPTQGTYTGIDTNRTTEFDVRTKAAPSSIKVKVGSQDVELRQATDLTDFQNSTNVYLLDQNYLTNSYLKDLGSGLEQTFLRIKLDNTDVSQNGITVTITGVDETANPVNQIPPESTAVAVPTDLIQDTAKTTSSAIAVSWQPVDGSQSYNLKVDGVLHANIKDPQFVLTDLKPATTHTFQVQAVTATATSPWSEEKTFKSNDDVFKNAVKINYDDTVSNITGTSIWQAAQPVKYLFDHDLSTVAHSNWFSSEPKQSATPMTITTHLDGITDLDRFVYVPRSDGGNGTITAMNIQTSVDGIHWLDAGSAANWPRNGESKEIKFAPGTKAYWVRFTIPENGSFNQFVSGQEFLLYQKDGTKPVLPGDINDDGVIDENDVTSLRNYAGETRGKDNDFTGYVEKGDINQNGMIDAFDINYVMTRLGNPPASFGESGQVIPSGKLTIATDKTSYNEGDIITVTVSGSNLKNVNALSARIPYNAEELSFEGVQNGSLTGNMVSFAKDKTHSDGSHDVFVIYSNEGEAPRLTGYGTVAVIKFKALKPLNGKTVALSLVDQMLVNQQAKELEPEDTNPITVKVKVNNSTDSGSNTPGGGTNTPGGGSNPGSNTTPGNTTNNTSGDTGQVNPGDKNQQQPKQKSTQVLKHNAYLYDKDGKKTDETMLKAGSTIVTFGTKIINSRKYYDLGNELYLAAGNVDGTERQLRRNSFIYNKRGQRVGRKVLRRKKKLVTYGSAISIKNKQYYMIGKNKLVKKVNFYK